ncbi:MAG: hypothetical protein ACREYF_23445 [Gammaproteobacteria bacterium]
MGSNWSNSALQFFRSMEDARFGGARSTPTGPVTLYGTSYAALGKLYMGSDEPLSSQTRRFILECQDPQTGLMIGPELRNFVPSPGTLHDREHLLLHLTCAALPVCRQFGLELTFPVRVAHAFADQSYLRDWLDRRDLKRAWFEGNNILFVGQLLVYLRDVEQLQSAQAALDLWFIWLDEHADTQTNLWGTNGYCSPTEAVYGGYHQLLVYYHEGHPILNQQGLVDTVLALQHLDGSFHPQGNGGACEDVDCVDILINAYKRTDYRRPEIRSALRQCLRHILALQNLDGGFPYNRNRAQSHMGVPGTEAGANVSTMFATWFRVHTLALMAEILTDEVELQQLFRFTNNLSMGWHQPWDRHEHSLVPQDRDAEKPFERRWKWRGARFQVLRRCAALKSTALRMRKLAGRLRRSALGQ